MSPEKLSFIKNQNLINMTNCNEITISFQEQFKRGPINVVGLCAYGSKDKLQWYPSPLLIHQMRLWEGRDGAYL